MTPEYASPEQLHGDKVTTASDVYSLGVLLYRLLTGHRPYALESRSIEELWDHIRNRPPRRPSTVIRASENGITPETICGARNTRVDRLERQLAGDIDNILLMALRKEPAAMAAWSSSETICAGTCKATQSPRVPIQCAIAPASLSTATVGECWRRPCSWSRCWAEFSPRHGSGT
jgi:serine/threonine protein kinase